MIERPPERKPQLLMRRDSLADLPAYSVPAGCVIRVARLEDEAGLAHLLTRAFDTDWDAARVHRSLTGAPDVDTVYVIASSGTVAATASARLDPRTFPGDGYLHWVGVLPEWRGKGLGGAICIRVLERFAELGLGGAVLETDDHRLDALRLYLKLGFRPVYRGAADPERWEAVLNTVGIRKEWENG